MRFDIRKGKNPRFFDRTLSKASSEIKKHIDQSGIVRENKRKTILEADQIIRDTDHVKHPLKK